MTRRSRNLESEAEQGWGEYMAMKKSKLDEQFTDEASKVEKVSDLFKGIAIFVNGFTIPSADEMRTLMMKYGGMYHHYYSTSSTTHVIATNLPDSKVKQLKGMKVVKPAWIVDSIEAKKVLDYKDYLLYTNRSVTQPALTFDNLSKSSTAAITASDERFLNEFFSNSRLHLISTMGATFKQYVSDLRADSKHKFTGHESLKALRGSFSLDQDETVIMHIDMDCFFASVGLTKRPELRGHPVAVTHAKTGQGPSSKMDKDESFGSMSEIASCSYEARAAGVKNGMLLGQALKLCPSLKTIPYDFDSYKAVSYSLYDTIARLTLDIEAVSCDEMYVDCSKILGEFNLSPLDFASHIRQEIKEKTGCPCSTGFGGNRLQARLATRKAKPNGQFYLKSEDVESYMKDINVTDLPGVGRSTAHKLRTMGINKCEELQHVTLSKLQAEFGQKFGKTLFQTSRGIDDKNLNFTQIRKSVSAEVNYGIRFKSDTERDIFLKQMSVEVSNRLNEIKMRGRCVTLKVMVRAPEAPEEPEKFMGHGLCDYVTKSVSLQGPISDADSILREVLTIMKGLNLDCKELRGIGIQITRLEKGPSTENAITKFLTKEPAQTTQMPKPVQKKAPEPTSEPKPSTSGRASTSRDFFQPKKPIQKKRRETDLFNLTISQVDDSFLEALPEDLRNEIVEGLQENHKKKEKSKQSRGGIAQMLTKTKPMSPKKATPTIKETPKEEPSDSDPTPDEIRVMLKEWIEAVDEPEVHNVKYLSDYCIKLVNARRLPDLQILLRHLYSYITRKYKNAYWKKAYGEVTKQTQLSVSTVYGGRLVLDAF